MGSVRTILANLFTALGGFFLLALTAAVGIALYLVTAPDSASAPAVADAVTPHPLMQAQLVAAPTSNVIRIASASPIPSYNPGGSSSGRSPRVRQLQKALARAGCYNGPVTGIWSSASKDAMRNFLKNANAELPVDTADDALIALMESNEAVQCPAARPIETGALGSSPPPIPGPAAKPAPAEPAAATDHSSDQPSLLGHAWAPEGMLVPPKDATPAPVANAAPEPTPSPAPHPTPAPQPVAVAAPQAAPVDTLRSPAVERTASNDVTATDAGPQPAPPPPTPIHFEGGTPLPAVQPVDPSSFAPESFDKPPTKPKKSKTAKRRPKGGDDDMQTSISKGIDQLQRSFSSMF